MGYSKEQKGQIKGKFLSALEMGHTIRRAAEYSGANRTTLYDWRDQEPSFARDWDHAVESGTDLLEDEVLTRALDREDTQSARLLIFLLKKRRPEFRDNFDTKTTVVHETVREISFSKEDVDEAIAILETAKSANDLLGQKPQDQNDDENDY